ncbi:MAG: hypothetical protein M1829_004542 [Trizodia sp. TS-e1964]|nr:MAG: hypothetical protein M1829_004542 [Trizodia sp. TS-e1964]
MNSTTVNRPTDPAARDQDVENKLRLYGIYSAFLQGKVPSNQQIDVALNSFLASKALSSPSSKLSSEGQHLVADVREAIEQAKLLLLTNNEGNLLQDFIWETQQLSGGSATVPGAPVDKNTAKQHGNEALEGLRTLGTLIISNGQFRKLLHDATILIRDMAGDAASTAAKRVNPSDDQRAQLDRPAEDNTWHDVPSKDGMKQGLKDQFNRNTPATTQDFKDAAGNASQAAHPSGSRDPQEIARLAAEDRRDGTQSGVDATGGAKAAYNTLRDRASDNVPDEHKERARNARERTKGYLADKMPQERREQTIWRLKKMVVEIQGHPDYQKAIETLLNLAETYAGHGKNVSKHGAGSVKAAHEDDHLTRAENDIKTLIERFANYTSLDDFFDSLNAIYNDANKDPQLKDWFKSMDAYVRKCLQEKGFILNDAATDEWNGLYDRGQYLLRDRYRNHTDRILDEVKFLSEQFERDPQNQKFAQAMQKLFNDLGNDENGKPTFKKHLLTDLSTVIIPGIFENVRYVPIPRIEYSDPTMDAIVENLIIESDNLMPNVFELGNDNYFRWGRKQITSKNKNNIMISVSGIQMDLKDVSYYVNKKSGFPSVKDIGVADIYMGGQGFSFKVKLSTADKTDRQHFFKVDKVDVDVKHLSIKLKQSRHKLLFGLFKPLLFKVVKPALQKVLEKQIRDSVHELDGIAWEINQEVERVKRDVKDDPTNVPNIYSRYYQAAQKKFMQGKKKTEAVAQDKKVNAAMTTQDSMFKDIKLPGGISTQATKFKELAAQGNKWESPVFSIGSAGQSTNIPKPAQITRKQHETAPSTIRGGQNTSAGESSSAGFREEVDQSFGHYNGNNSTQYSTGQAFNGYSNVSYPANGNGSYSSKPITTDGTLLGRGLETTRQNAY